MTFKLKALAAALSFAVAGGAQAAIFVDDPNNSSIAITGNGTGELFLAIAIKSKPVDKPVTVKSSYIVDLGISANSFTEAALNKRQADFGGVTFSNTPLSPLSFSAAQLSSATLLPSASASPGNFASFMNSIVAGDFVTWNIGAMSNDGTLNALGGINKYGILTTANAGYNGEFNTTIGDDLGAGGLSSLGNLQQKLVNYVGAVNAAAGETTNYASNKAIQVAAGTSASYDSQDWGGNLFGFSSESGLGEAARFWFVSLRPSDDTGTRTIVSKVPGTWLLTTSGLTFTPDAVAPVPVPAAVWLFGSALTGLAGLRRRRA